MADYIYNGFKISYSIEPVISLYEQKSPFKAIGTAQSLLNRPTLRAIAHQAQSSSFDDAEDDIKSLLENEVDQVLMDYYSRKKMVI